MYLIADREGNITPENSFQDRFLECMYARRAGRLLLRPLISPVVSRIGGRLLESGCSRILIRPFIRSHSIDMSDYETKKYSSYNDFFTRKLISGARRIEWAPDVFISPCDSCLSVFKMDEDCVFSVKHTRYTAETVLHNRKLAGRYAGGYVWVFRLRVKDYHRYVYVDCGKESRSFRIRGVFHTVNPAAGDRVPIYKENTREYSLLKSENFGIVLQMEVGALMVGRIENHHGEKNVRRGQEKGNFAFGGSTIILMTQKNEVCPDRDILKNSEQGIETQVRLGERIGVKQTGQKTDGTSRNRFTLEK